MAKETKVKTASSSRSGIYMIFAAITAMIGYHIHNSIAWAIFDFIFWWFDWVKWLICHQVTATIIRETFSFFFK